MSPWAVGKLQVQGALIGRFVEPQGGGAAGTLGPFVNLWFKVLH